MATFKDITYLYVSFAEKDAAKLLGAHWDKNRKQWFCPTVLLDKFTRWTEKPVKIYLSVSYEARNVAKDLGAKLDRGKTSWYCYKENFEAIDKFGVHDE